MGFLIPVLCKLFNYEHKIKDLEKLKKFVDIDVNFIIFRAQMYNKFFNTNIPIDLDILSKELNNEKNKLLN